MNLEAAQADGYDVQTALNLTMAQLEDAVDGMKQQAYATARTKADYKAKMANGILHYTATKSVAATNMKAVVEGTYAKEAMFEAELAEMLWECCKEEVMLRKREADVLREELARMHSEAGKGWQ